MVDLRWDGDDFRNEQSSSGTTADQVSHNGKLQQGYKHGSLTQGLVAYYPIEKGEGEVVQDGVLNALGQIRGAEWTPEAAVGNYSLDFKANNEDDINLGKNYRYTEGGPWTICTYFYSRDVSSTRQFVTDNRENKENNTPVTRNIGYKDSKLTVYTGGGGSWVYGNTDLSNNTWYHAVYRYNGDGTLTFYLNGQDDGTVSVQSDSSSYCDIGYLMSKNGQRYHDGYATDFRIYDRRLSEPEIKALSNLKKHSGIQRTEKQVPGQNQDGVSRYKFDGGVTDSWGNNDGTNKGATFNTGVHGQAAEFNGSSDYIQSPSSINQSSTWSLSLWGYYNFDPSSMSQDYRIHFAQKGGSTSNGGSWIGCDNNDNNGALATFIGSSHTHFNYVPEPNTWLHHTLVHDASSDSISLYINGNLQESASVAAESADGGFTIGTWKGTDGQFFKGKIDDVRIYNTALTPVQVEKLYQKGAYRIPRESTLQ